MSNFFIIQLFQNLGTPSYANFSPSPYGKLFPSMGVASSQGSGYSPYEHDYAPKGNASNNTHSEFNNSGSSSMNLYSKISNDYQRSDSQQSSSSSMDSPGPSHLNFFQSPLGLGSGRSSDNSVASPSVSIANIANQLQAFANQNSQSFPQVNEPFQFSSLEVILY